MTIFKHDRCATVEEFKEWGINIGLENTGVTMNSYLPFPKQHKEDLIKKIF
ncbi:hypothetical protein [uncultured Sulfitobacter sp.]|uniref:hypothetical protein n=1 Tax=uncultured Sulfitobacter sp. TaxID=191468 RepID=UPI002618D6C5|nr:hypothetical protein [uncultured Sulfitobacter sp.]